MNINMKAYPKPLSLLMLSFMLIFSCSTSQPRNDQSQCILVNPANLNQTFGPGCLGGSCLKPRRTYYDEGCPEGSAFFEDGTAYLWRNCHDVNKGTWRRDGNVVIGEREMGAEWDIASEQCVLECTNGFKKSNEAVCRKQCAPDGTIVIERTIFSATSESNFNAEISYYPKKKSDPPLKGAQKRVVENLGCLQKAIP